MSDSPTFKKIAIVGVGAIGGLFAGWLGSRLPAGQVQTLGGGARRNAAHPGLRERGLVWVDADGAGNTAHRSTPATTRTSLGAQDLVIVSVKGPAMPAVAPAVRRAHGSANHGCWWP